MGTLAQDPSRLWRSKLDGTQQERIQVGNTSKSRQGNREVSTPLIWMCGGGKLGPSHCLGYLGKEIGPQLPRQQVPGEPGQLLWDFAIFYLQYFSLKQVSNGNHYGNSIHVPEIYFSHKFWLNAFFFLEFFEPEIRCNWFQSFFSIQVLSRPLMGELKKAPLATAH